MFKIMPQRLLAVKSKNCHAGMRAEGLAAPVTGVQSYLVGLGCLADVLALPDDTQVTPGHGPQTTINDERETNPFLQK
jgi:hypothetical protein